MKTTELSQTKSIIRQMLIAAICVAAANLGMAQAPNRGMLAQQPGGLIPTSGGCSISQLDMQFRTGSDDLRGGGNDLNVEVHFVDGTIKFVKNVNKSANWGNNSSHVVSIPLDRPVAPNQIRSIRLIHLTQGGYSADGAAMALSPSQEAAMLGGIKTEDNWDMADMRVAAPVGNGPQVQIMAFGFHRFTGSNSTLEVLAFPNITCAVAGQVTQLQFDFQTGNDDLRGGNDNLNITIFADGLTQKEANVNGSQRWADGSAHHVTLMLNHPVDIHQIPNILLDTTFDGGYGGDNWNMESVHVYARVNGTNVPIATEGFFRFAGPPRNRLMVATK